MALFTWNDGVQAVFTTTTRTPRVSEQYQGVGQTVPTLDGGAFLAYQYHSEAGSNVVQCARVVSFEWEIVPDGLAAMALTTWRFARSVTVHFISPLDFTTVDSITGFIPAQTPPEVESQGGRVAKLKVTIQEARV